MSTLFEGHTSTQFGDDAWRRAADTWKEIGSLISQNRRFRYRYSHEVLKPFEVRDDPDRLKDGTYLRDVVDHLRHRAMKNSVQKNLSSCLYEVSINPSTVRQWTKAEAVKEAVDSITADTEAQLVDKAVDHSTTCHQDMPLNSEVVLTAISESIIEYMERKISPEMLKASKQGWDDRCKLRTVGEIEHSLTVPFGERNRYQPNTQTHARHVSTMNLSLPPSRLQHMIDVRVKRADEAKIRLNKAAALAPNRLISLSDDDFATANEEIESRLDSYMVMNKPMDIAQVVNSQSHLSEEEWREHGDLFGAFYRKTLNNGEKTLENFFQDCKQGFASMDHPPQLSFWISKGDPSANSEKITIPDADTFEETAKSVGMFRARGEPFSVWEGLSDRGF